VTAWTCVCGTHNPDGQRCAHCGRNRVSVASSLAWVILGGLAVIVIVVAVVASILQAAT
jgi:hypothetical protein